MSHATVASPFLSWRSGERKSVSPIATEAVEIENYDKLVRIQSISTSSIAEERPLGLGAGEAPMERVYPHLCDEDSDEGKARQLLVAASDEAQYALDAFSEGEISDVGTYLANISAIVTSAHSFTGFNRHLGAIVSYIRRATMSKPGCDVSLSELNVLVSVLLSLAQNPLLNLASVAELTEKLSDAGWEGELGVTSSLLDLFYLSDDAEDELKQAV